MGRNQLGDKGTLGESDRFDLMDVNGDPERLFELLKRRYGISGRCGREELGEFMAGYMDNSDEGVPRA